MSANDYNFLHGFPTVCRVDVDCEDDKCLGFDKAVQKSIKQRHAKWSDAWAECKQLQCEKCKAERKRRTRVLGCARFGGLSQEEGKKILDSPDFADCIYITECNKPVCLYGMMRARSFARIRDQQLLWIQAEDTPPSEHFGHYTREELMEQKKNGIAPLTMLAKPKEFLL